MPAFQALLTQLASEYERVESALADAIAELRVREGRYVRAGPDASWTPSGGSPKRAVGWQDEETEDEEEVEEEGEEQAQVLMCESGRSQSPEPASPTTPTMESVAEEGLALTVFPVATTKVRSRGASGPPSLLPIPAGSATTGRRRHHIPHRPSRLSPMRATATGSAEGVTPRPSNEEGSCAPDTWQTYMIEKESPRRSWRSPASVKSPRPSQGMTARISRAFASGACSVRDEPRSIGSGSSPLKAYRTYLEETMPRPGRLSVRTFQMASPWVINPDHSAALEKWDQVTVFALAYVAIVTPVQVSMIEAKLDGVFFVNSVIDFVFLCDMILQFFLMYPQKAKGVYSLEYRHPKIIAHYLKTWFAIDILSIAPVDLIAILSNFAGGQQLKIVKTIRLMRLLKLFRVLRASRVFHRFETRMSITYGRLAILKFFVVLFVITHWLANLWALTLVIVDENEGVPRWVDGVTELEDNVEVKTKDSPAKLYIACLYFTSYTITSVGYGDIGPQNISERVVLTFIVIVSGISWAVILGEVCGIVTNMDKDEHVFRSTMDELNAMMQDRLIPVPMRTRLRSFFLSNKSAQKKALHFKIMSAMSPGLRGEVSWAMNRFWLEKVNFLKPLLKEASEHRETGIILCLRPFVFDMSLMMEQVVCAQGEAFGVPHRMYILNRGLVDRRNRVFRMGSVWGSDFVLSDRRLLEPVNSHALTYAELTTLSRHHFFDLVQRHSMSFPEIGRTVRRYCCWLAFQRALLIEARRRQALFRGKMMGMADTLDLSAPMRSVSGARPCPLPPTPPLTP